MRRILLLVLATAVLQAEDWPQWRGKDRLGVWDETGILSKFPAGGPQRVWSAPIADGYAGRPSPLRASSPPTTAEQKAAAGPSGFCASTSGRASCSGRRNGPSITAVCNTPSARGPRRPWTATEFTSWGDGRLVLPAGAGRRGDLARDYQKDYNAELPTWGFVAAPLVTGRGWSRWSAARRTQSRSVRQDDRKELCGRSTLVGAGLRSADYFEAGGVRQLIVWHPTDVPL